MFNVESLQELDMLDRVAAELGRRAPVALRINPDVDPQTHPYISTGMEKNKFGIRMQDAPAAYADAAARTHIEVIGVDCHIGSQITSISPFVDALKRVRAFVEQLHGSGIPVRFLDIGGGLGIMYDSESPPDPADYARAVMDEVRDLGCTLILEPGRVISGNAGILVTKVLYVKRSGARTFIIVDAAMNDLVRPSLYDAFHAIRPVVLSGRDEIVADVVGPICESGDFIARNRLIPAVEPGELLAVMSAGAYGFSMASNYNSRPRVPEIMVDGQRSLVIRRRETYADLVRLEDIPGIDP
jgi:diaminopimelate decarboxylase